MIAEFYLIPDSFANNSNFSITEIETKTNNLAIDFNDIKKYKDSNKLFVHPDIYNVEFINGVSLSDLLYNDEIANQNLDRDTRISLKLIIIESAVTTYTVDDVINILLPEHNEDICYGLIAFNPVNNIDTEFQIIYDIRGWFDFRRHFLGIYPKNSNFYIDECIKYFPNLFFHERNKETIKLILNICSNKIVYHLSALNDKFRDSQLSDLNRSDVLRQFSIINNLDETASLEGNASKKMDLTFAFINDEMEIEEVCCEPHLKLCRSDNYPGDGSYSNNRRIYFHEGKANIQNGRILIGHIGAHL